MTRTRDIPVITSLIVAAARNDVIGARRHAALVPARGPAPLQAADDRPPGGRRPGHARVHRGPAGQAAAGPDLDRGQLADRPARSAPTWSGPPSLDAALDARAAAACAAAGDGDGDDPADEVFVIGGAYGLRAGAAAGRPGLPDPAAPRRRRRHPHAARLAGRLHADRPRRPARAETAATPSWTTDGTCRELLLHGQPAAPPSSSRTWSSWRRAACACSARTAWPSTAGSACCGRPATGPSPRTSSPIRAPRCTCCSCRISTSGDLLDLDRGGQADFWTALGWVRDRYELTYYGLGVRNGDCRYSGATIRHVHAHVLVGDPDVEPEVPVRMRFSSRPPTP